MEIKINSISAAETKTKGKNTWQEVVVEYTGAKGPGKRSLRSFDAQVWNDFKTIKPGDTVDVKVVKEGDYWNWKGANVVEGKPESVGAAASSGGSKKVGDWETAEERAKKQIYIVRQSSISSAVCLLARDGILPDVEQVLDMAKQFEAYVFGVDDDSNEPAKDAPAKRGRPPKAPANVADAVE